MVAELVPEADHLDGGRPAATISMRDLLSDARTPRSDWSISDVLAIELIGHLERSRPRRILEVGSGFSTAILAAYAAEYGAEVVTLEHMPEYHDITAKALMRLSLDGSVDLRLAPLRTQYFGGNGPYRWYDASLEGRFDFVFVDGPPKIEGRQGVFFAVEGHLENGWQMWLDDGLRKHERRCRKLWERHFQDRFSWSRLDLGSDDKGVFILSDAAAEKEREEQQAILEQVAIGVLGGGDSDWWSRARSNVGDQLLASSYVVVAARDGKPVASLPKFVDNPLPADGRPSQQRIRRLLKELAGHPGVRYVLYLDDRWSPCTLDERWLLRALDILERDPQVAQVSLRHQIDVTGDETEGGCSGSFTFPPSLLRAERTRRMLPSRGAEVCQRVLAKCRRAGPAPQLRTVQLWPGVFRFNDHRPDGEATDDNSRLEESTALMNWRIVSGVLSLGVALGVIVAAGFRRLTCSGQESRRQAAGSD